MKFSADPSSLSHCPSLSISALSIMRLLSVSVLFVGAATLTRRADASNETQPAIPKKFILEAGDVREPLFLPSQISAYLHAHDTQVDANTYRPYRV